MGELLNKYNLNGIDFKISNIKGGGASNSIPVESEVTLFIKSDDLKILKALNKEFKLEKLSTEKNIKVKTINEKLFNQTDVIIIKENIFKKKFQEKLIHFLLLSPNSIKKYHDKENMIIDTSINFSNIFIKEGVIHLNWLIRSINKENKNYYKNKIRSMMKLMDSDITEIYEFPFWNPTSSQNPVLKIAKDSYYKLFNKYPIEKMVHAGIENSILGEKYFALKNNMISLGPTILFQHTINEALDIDSVARTYDWLKLIIFNINNNFLF
jgi:dipeptidase D